MYSFFQHSILYFILFSLIAVSCNSSSDPFDIPPPDLTTVPDPYDIENMPRQEIEPGVEIIIHEEGLEQFFVTNRDEISVYLSLWSENGDIIYSTFANNSESPTGVSVRESGSFQNIVDIRQFSVLMAYSPGFKIGLLGMREGEKRTIIVSPEKGYQNAPSGLYVSQFRDDTLYYDIKVSGIFPRKIKE